MIMSREEPLSEQKDILGIKRRAYQVSRSESQRDDTLSDDIKILTQGCPECDSHEEYSRFEIHLGG
jgi:hypothetical protein